MSEVPYLNDNYEWRYVVGGDTSNLRHAQSSAHRRVYLWNTNTGWKSVTETKEQLNVYVDLHFYQQAMKVKRQSTAMAGSRWFFIEL